VVGHKWVHNPSSVSGLSSIPLTPDVGQGGFNAEARGTSHAIHVAQIASGVTGASTSASGQVMRRPSPSRSDHCSNWKNMMVVLVWTPTSGSPTN